MNRGRPPERCHGEDAPPPNLRKRIEIVPSTWPDRLDLAQLLEAGGRFDGAEEMYRAWNNGVELDPY